MDRASACGAEDPGSIPGERTKLPAVLLLLLLAATSSWARFASTDGVLALAERRGWSPAPATGGAVLRLRRGRGVLTASPAPDDAPLGGLLGVEAGLARVRVGPAERRVSSGGLAYVVAQAGADGLLGALSVDRVRYVLRARGVPRAEAVALLDTLERQDEERPAAAMAPPPRPPPAPPSLPEASLFHGTVRLQRPPLARLVPQRDGWLEAVGEGWSLGLLDGPYPGVRGAGRAAARAYIAARAASLSATRGCGSGDPLEQPLADGWTVVYAPLACRGAAPGRVTFVGAALRPAGAPLWLAGEYATTQDFDGMMAWLASARDESRPTRRPEAGLSRWEAVGGIIFGGVGLALLAWRGMRRAS